MKIDLKPRDTILTENGNYLIVSAEGFNLKDEGAEANYILINVKYGSMEGHVHSLDEIQTYYIVKGVRRFSNEGECKQNQ